MSLKAKLETGQAVVGAFLGLRSPDAAELMSQAGYDFLLVDAEHSNIGPDSMLEMLRAIDRGRATPLVRQRVPRTVGPGWWRRRYPVSVHTFGGGSQTGDFTVPLSTGRHPWTGTRTGKRLWCKHA